MPKTRTILSELLFYSIFFFFLNITNQDAVYCAVADSMLYSGVRKQISFSSSIVRYSLATSDAAERVFGVLIIVVCVGLFHPINTRGPFL